MHPQAATFLRWFSFHAQLDTPLTDFIPLQDGRLLLAFLHLHQPERLNTKIHQCINVGYLLKKIDEPIGISAEEIVQGNEKAMLGR